MSLDIFVILLDYYICLRNHIFMTYLLFLLLVLSLHKRVLFFFFFTNFYVSVLHGYCGSWEGWVPINRFNHTSLRAVVTQTDRPKSERNCCVFEVLVAFLCGQLVVEFSVGIGVFVMGLNQISFFFSLYTLNQLKCNTYIFRYISNMDLSIKICFRQTIVFFIFYRKIVLCIDWFSMCIFKKCLFENNLPDSLLYSTWMFCISASYCLS